MRYFFVILISFGVVAVLTPVVRAFALRRGVVDLPDEPRKVHGKPMPLLGGLAIFLGFIAVLWYVALATPYILTASIKLKHLVGITFGGTVLMVGGYFDDRYRLKPVRQIIFPILAALIIIVSGIGIRQITNPFGGTLSLVSWERVLFWWDGIGYRLTLPADLLTLVWLLGMMYTTKFLDGLDGLVSGLAVVGSVMIMLLATVTQFYQPEVGMLSAMSAGVFLGFLIFNFYPAKIFLGEGGSLFAGFMLGTLAIISGGKIATALLVLGIPLLDMVWVILRRIFWEKKLPSIGDSGHLHFRLRRAGFSHHGAVFLLWAMAAIFGTTTVFFQSAQKVIALGVLVLAMIVLGAWVMIKHHAARNM